MFRKKSGSLLYWWHIHVSLCCVWQFMETGNFFLCLSLQKGLPFDGQFILIKLYNYSCDANCFLLYTCHSSMAQSPNFQKNAVVSSLVLIRGFWRRFVGAEVTLGHFPSISHGAAGLQFSDFRNGVLSPFAHIRRPLSLFLQIRINSYFYIPNWQPLKRL